MSEVRECNGCQNMRSHERVEACRLPCQLTFGMLGVAVAVCAGDMCWSNAKGKQQRSPFYMFYIPTRPPTLRLSTQKPRECGRAIHARTHQRPTPARVRCDTLLAAWMIASCSRSASQSQSRRRMGHVAYGRGAGDACRQSERILDGELYPFETNTIIVSQSHKVSFGLVGQQR